MQIILGLFCLLLFLFIVYKLSSDDFILLRKNITLEDIFNIVFIGLFSAFFMARLTFVFLHPKSVYLNPLVFFLVPYFPGLSLSGGVIGLLGYVLFFIRKKKIPLYRLLDIITLGFMYSFAFAQLFLFVWSMITSIKNIAWLWYFGASLLSFFIIIPFTTFFVKGTWRDGATTIFSLLVLALIVTFQEAVNTNPKIVLFFSGESFIILWIAVIALLFSFISMALNGKRRK